MAFGRILIVEGYNCHHVHRLDSEQYIERFLLDIIGLVGMTLAPMHGKYSNPTIYREPIRDKGKGPGITGVAILQESNVDIHTYPEKACFFSVLFSCKEFDEEIIISFIKNWSGTEDIVTKSHVVGDLFPK